MWERLDKTAPRRLLGDQHELVHVGFGDVLALAEERLQRRVAARAVDQLRDPGFGEARAGVAGDRVHHDPVAAGDEHVGDDLADRSPLGDRQHVVAPLRHRDRDEVVVGEPPAARQDRARHHDLVMGERPHDAARRIRCVGEAACELGPRPRLDRRRKPGDHEVEELDLLVGERDGVAQEQIGDLAQRLEAALLRAAADRVLEIRERPRDDRRGLLIALEEGGGCGHGAPAGKDLRSSVTERF